ncbi:MAG: hypothetical protein P8Y70_17500 [Candidatus Lokiarchaeota archaeon]
MKSIIYEKYFLSLENNTGKYKSEQNTIVIINDPSTVKVPKKVKEFVRISIPIKALYII